MPSEVICCAGAAGAAAGGVWAVAEVIANEAPNNAAAANADIESMRIMIYPLLVKLPASCSCLPARAGMLDALSMPVQG